MKRCAILTDFKASELICYKSEVRFLSDELYEEYVVHGWVKELNEVDLPEDVIIPEEVTITPNGLTQSMEIPNNG